MDSKKVFIAGPIENVDEFNKTENELTALGFSVINPQKFWSLPKNEGNAKYENLQNLLVTDIIPLHICALNLCRYIYLISGWSHDEIASIEYDYACKTGKWVLTKESLFEFLKGEAASDNPFFKVAYNKFIEKKFKESDNLFFNFFNDVITTEEKVAYNKIIEKKSKEKANTIAESIKNSDCNMKISDHVSDISKYHGQHGIEVILKQSSNSYSTDNKHKDDRLDATHMEDAIHHPKHYQGKNGMEVIDVIDNFACDPVPENCIYDEGNAIKYLLRWAKKNGIEDLNKCKEYIDFMIKKLEDNPVE